MTRSLALGLLISLWPGLALAVPGQLAHQGRLVDNNDVPLEGEHSLQFTLYDSAEDGGVIWEEALDVDFSNGYYSTILGTDEEDNPLDTEVLGQHPLFLGLAVDGGDELAPLHEVLSVPYAIMADTCENVSGGIVDASEIRVDGEPVITEGGTWSGATPSVDWSDLTGVPAGFADNIDDDTVLGESEVDAYIEAYIADTPVALAEGSTIGGASIAAGETVPSGGIIMWSGSEVPDGWALCNGEDGTPDLRNRFVVGSGDAYTMAETGGSSGDLEVSTSLCGSPGGWPLPTGVTCVTGVTGGGGTPSYYALAYIMKL